MPAMCGISGSSRIVASTAPVGCLLTKTFNVAFLPTLVAYHATKDHGCWPSVPQITILEGLIPAHIARIVAPMCTPGIPLPSVLVATLLLAPTVPLAALVASGVLATVAPIIAPRCWLVLTHCCHHSLVSPLSQHVHVFKGIGEVEEYLGLHSFLQSIQIQRHG